MTAGHDRGREFKIFVLSPSLACARQPPLRGGQGRISCVGAQVAPHNSDFCRWFAMTDCAICAAHDTCLLSFHISPLFWGGRFAPALFFYPLFFRKGMCYNVRTRY